MAIIYSYPKVVTLNSSDLLIGSRFENEGGGARTISFTTETLVEYVGANYANTLNQVLTAGNESLLDAKVGGIYLYNANVPSGNGYVYIIGNKNRFNFYNNAEFNLGYLAQNTLTLIDPIVTSRQFQINTPSGITANRTATFQNASGTIAYLSDITSLNLNQVLTNGNESLLNAKIGQLYLWDNPNNQYSTIRITDSAFIIEGIQGITGPLLQIEPGILNLKASGNFIGSFILSGLTDNRNYALPNKSGTIALTSDIPTTTNYGLATQLANSTPIVNTTTKSTLNGSSYAGTLSVPANGFSVGDSFNAYMMGHISNNNNVGLTITIETVAGVVLATTGLMTLAVSSNNHWVLDVDFVIRAIGTTGTASIITAGNFSHSKSANNNLETYNFVSENTTTFNTTVANELVIKAQWSTASASNSIYSNVFILNKVY